MAVQVNGMVSLRHGIHAKARQPHPLERSGLSRQARKPHRDQLLHNREQANSEINDRSRIGYGTKQTFVEGADPSKRLTNNDELSLDKGHPAIRQIDHAP